jgi:hypothetical protein
MLPSRKVKISVVRRYILIKPSICFAGLRLKIAQLHVHHKIFSPKERAKRLTERQLDLSMSSRVFPRVIKFTVLSHIDIGPQRSPQVSRLNSALLAKCLIVIAIRPLSQSVPGDEVHQSPQQPDTMSWWLSCHQDWSNVTGSADRYIIVDLLWTPGSGDVQQWRICPDYHQGWVLHQAHGVVADDRGFLAKTTEQFGPWILKNFTQHSLNLIQGSIARRTLK